MWPLSGMVSGDSGVPARMLSSVGVWTLSGVPTKILSPQEGRTMGGVLVRTLSPVGVWTTQWCANEDTERVGIGQCASKDAEP